MAVRPPSRYGTRANYLMFDWLWRQKEPGGAATAEPVSDNETGILYRTERTDLYTLGELHVLGEMFYILERPWLNNASNISCIPPSVYLATFMARSGSGKYTNVYWVRDVPNRGGILVHNGVVVRHSLGCLLIGLRCGMYKGERAVFNSRSGLAEFGELLDGVDLDLTIQNA